MKFSSLIDSRLYIECLKKYLKLPKSWDWGKLSGTKYDEFSVAILQVHYVFNLLISFSEDIKKVYLLFYNLSQFVGFLYILIVMGIRYLRDGPGKLQKWNLSFVKIRNVVIGYFIFKIWLTFKFYLYLLQLRHRNG